VTSFEIENMVAEIEGELNATGKSENLFQRHRRAGYGETQTLTKSAYVRFASVYRKFADTAEFLEEMKRILEK